tara:strand:+ start:145 stop:597 length:453 start_codon:yes stop_codon:yes gene_type:complete
MAKPLSALTHSAIRSATESIYDLTTREVFTLATQGMISMDENGEFELTSRATRAVKRARKAEAAAEIRPKVWEAVTQVSQDAEKMFRLDDVLKASGLDKGEHRQNILEALRHFRDGGMMESIKLSDNNFQIFWKRTPESLPAATDDAGEE